MDVKFLSHGKECRAWLYLPEGQRKPPVIVMAHGIACEKAFRLPAFAERFVQRGLAVLVFDYRYIGESDGGPRNLVYYKRQLEDWKNAVAFVRTLSEVDRESIGLWGTSFSGGHVLVTAAKDSKIKAVSAHVPFTDGLSLLRTKGIFNLFNIFRAGFTDLYRTISLTRPFFIPVVARPGTLAFMNHSGAMEGYFAMIPANSRWENKCPARSCLSIPLYRPIRYASKISCPALIIMGDRDQVIPPRSVLKLSRRLKRRELVRLPMDHFDSYVGEMFEKVVERQADFFARQLLG
ncbi:MAG: acetylxylan esterase [Bacillota bacterium]|nr:acetylxylan esterase [Bacillota bacterium]